MGWAQVRIALGVHPSSPAHFPAGQATGTVTGGQRALAASVHHLRNERTWPSWDADGRVPWGAAGRAQVQARRPSLVLCISQISQLT